MFMHFLEQVFIHVYDVSQENSIKRLNRFTAHKKSPVKFGGIFHAGVEINGLEWSYGATFSETACGVACNEPKQHPQHRYFIIFFHRRIFAA